MKLTQEHIDWINKYIRQQIKNEIISVRNIYHIYRVGYDEDELWGKFRLKFGTTLDKEVVSQIERCIDNSLRPEIRFHKIELEDFYLEEY